MLLSIVTLNYKKKDLTRSCLESLYEQFEKEFTNGTIEQIIVDNASEDGSVEFLREEIKKKKYKNVHLIANKENGGFGKGCNIGADAGHGKYLLFLNNDTVVKDTGLLNMTTYMDEHPEIAILGGRLRNFDESLQPSAGKFYTPINALLLLLGMQKFGLLYNSPSTISPVDWVKGALFMIRSDVFAKLGGFDEKIFMYTEDMELCYRAKLVGYKVFFYPGVKIIHTELGSSNRTFAIVNIYENLLYFYKKHRTPGEYIFLKTALRTKAIFLIGVGRLLHKDYLTHTYEKALKVA
jgi:GT2 family glycosyltransferase